MEATKRDTSLLNSCRSSTDMHLIWLRSEGDRYLNSDVVETLSYNACYHTHYTV